MAWRTDRKTETEKAGALHGPVPIRKDHILPYGDGPGVVFRVFDRLKKGMGKTGRNIS